MRCDKIDGQMTRFAIVVLGAILAVTTEPSKSFAADGDEQAVRKVIDDFNKARRARDVKAFVSLYTEDAEIGPPDGNIMRGRAEIQKNFEQLFASMTSGADRDRIIKTVRFVRPDVAVVSTTADGPGVRIFDVFVMTKEGQQWKIASRHGASVRPPEQPTRK